MTPVNQEIRNDAAPRTVGTKASIYDPTAGAAPARVILDSDAFVSMLYLERRRAERAQKRFVLMLVDLSQSLAGQPASGKLTQVTFALSNLTRETDIVGWYLEPNVIGVIGTEIGDAKTPTVQDRLLEKVRIALHGILETQEISLASVYFHFFPEELEKGDTRHSVDFMFYPDLSRQEKSKKLALGIKRVIDIIGSASALIALSPFFGVVAAAVKLSSKGPVFFRQQRLGQYGKSFTMFKFRSMRIDSETRIQQEYVKQFIGGQASGDGSDKAPVFKIQKDPRVTGVGRFIRKTSLDELPQFWNVLIGDMSLVGPRPPVAYEFDAYDAWHRRRVFEIKPGITGLWQINGRSRMRFDDMVRLDLKYARAWSVWLDLKILMQTPRVVIKGEGAH